MPKKSFFGSSDAQQKKKTLLVENFAETSQRNRKFSLEAESVFIVMYLFFSRMGPQNEAEEERLRKAKRVKQVFVLGCCMRRLQFFFDL